MRAGYRETTTQEDVVYSPASDAVLADGAERATATRAFRLPVVSAQPQRLHAGVTRRREPIAVQQATQLVVGAGVERDDRTRLDDALATP